MNNGKGFGSVSLQRFVSGVVLKKAMVLAALLLGAALTISQANAQDYGFVKANLDWSAAYRLKARRQRSRHRGTQGAVPHQAAARYYPRRGHNHAIAPLAI